MSEDISKEVLEDLYEDAPCGYIFTYLDGAISRVNQTFLSWIGYDRTAVAHMHFQDLLTTPGKIFFENQYAPLLWMQGSVKEVAFDLRCKDGTRLPVLVNSNLRANKQGEHVLIASTIFDASDRQRYEHELRLARERAEQLAEIVKSATDAILTANTEGMIQTWNAGAVALFGYSAHESVKQNFWQLLPALRHQSEREQVLYELRAGRSVSMDTIGKHKDSRDIDVSVSIVPHLGHIGELIALSAIVRDISERRALDRMQQEFLAMTSHELRHPLTIIKVSAQIMQRRKRFSEPEVDAIIDQSDQLEQLIDELLVASLIEADRFEVWFERIDLVSEVRLIADRYSSQKHPVHLESSVDNLELLGDKHRLGQVFANLLSNAIKYSPEGSKIIVRISVTEESAFISVIDQGSGIEADLIPSLFNRFFRAGETRHQATGLGLGLYISHNIVSAHRGALNVQSSVGEGSTFTVTLPRNVDTDA